MENSFTTTMPRSYYPQAYPSLCLPALPGTLEPGEIVPATRRAIQQTHEGTPALLEFMTAQEITFSQFT
jgi:hypothetical protein